MTLIDPAQPAAKPMPPLAVVAACVAGNALEFYDFISYAFFAVAIGNTFFPTTTPLNSLLLSLGVFGVGFLARPLGGALIGAYADRAGRKPAMLLTIALITVGTLGLALTPSFERIGLAAPILVVACRLVQGLALGGEVGPASAFLVEIAPAGRRGFFTSWQGASQGAAVLTAGLVGQALTAALSPEDMQSWGWRLAFLVGLLLVPLAMYLRRAMPETLHDAQPSVEAPSVEAQGVRALLRHARHMLLSVMAILGATVCLFVSSYMTTFATTTLKLSAADAMSATVLNGVCMLAFSLVGGWLCDRYGRKPTMLWPRIAVVLLVVPTFMGLVASPSRASLLLATALLATVNNIGAAAVFCAIPELFPRGIRATGMAVTYAVGVSLFGGSTQFVVIPTVDKKDRRPS
jgi:MFS family permease